ncbi:MAG: DUF4157 domain-containing protein [Chloroflexi bacterium]|nr:DUF4157 domain-containing protein [Chloroflexota bacterium]MDA1228101.1 DUF4157 domain-containing protein [Chloroflexota bacterium]
MAVQLSLSDEAREVLANWYEASLINDTSVLKGSLFGNLFGLFGQHAVTINGRVHVTRHAPDISTDFGIMLVGHEFFHVQDQHQRGWWAYLFAYAKGWRPAHINNGTSHPMESGAYARGSEVLRLVQTQRRDRENDSG